MPSQFEDDVRWILSMQATYTRASYESAVIAGLCFAVAGIGIDPLSWLLTTGGPPLSSRSVADWPFFSAAARSFFGAFIVWRLFMPFRVNGRARQLLRGVCVGSVIACVSHFIVGAKPLLVSAVEPPPASVTILRDLVVSFRQLWIAEVILGACAGVVATLITNRPPGPIYGGMTEEDIENFVESQPTRRHRWP